MRKKSEGSKGEICLRFPLGTTFSFLRKIHEDWFIFALAFLFLTLPPRIFASFEINIKFSENLQFQEIDTFTRVTYKGSVPYHLPGAPDIPVLSYIYHLHPDEEVVDVKVLNVKWVPIKKGILSPAQMPSVDSQLKWTPPNKKFYKGIFPKKPLIGYKEGGLYGEKVLGIVVSPIRYDPERKLIFFSKEINLKVITRFSEKRPLKPKRACPAALRARIEALNRAVEGGKATYGEFSSPRQGDFTPSFPPSLQGSPVAYVIITTDDLLNSFAPLADWYTKIGLPAVIRTVSWIEANYQGSDRAERIRNFIKDAYEFWGTQWVLLGGDHEEVPMRFVFVNLPSAGEYRNVPTDRYYASLEGNWNQDGDDTFGEMEDSVDLYPEVFVARLPARYPEEAENMVQKILNYAQNPGDGDGSYLEKALFLGSSMFQEGDGADLCEEVSGHFPDYLFKGKIYETDSYSPTTEEFIDSLDQGYGMVFTESHANFSFLLVCFTPSRSFRIGHVYLLQNHSKPFFLHMVNCNAGGVDKECLAENLMRAEGGAFAVYSTTRLNYPYIDVDMTGTLYDTLFQGQLSELSMWINQGQMPYLPYAELYENYSRYILLGYTLLGDPALNLRTSAPPGLRVTSPAGISVGSQKFTVSVFDSLSNLPAEGVLVTVSKKAEIYTSALTGPAGEANFFIEPETPGSLLVWATGSQYIPASKKIPVTGEGSWISIAECEIDDSILGDGDGIPEVGETLLVNLWLENSGNTPTSQRAVRLLANLFSIQF